MTSQTQEQDEIFNNITNQKTWIRLIYMLIYGVILHLAGMLMWILCAVQFIFSLIFGQDNENIRRMCDSLSKYIYESLAFVSYNSDDKPFPFSDKSEGKANCTDPADAKDGEVIDVKIDKSETTADASADRQDSNSSDADKDSPDSRS